METITIEVEPEIARAYRNLSPTERQKIQIVLNIWLKQIINKIPIELDELIQRMQDRTNENDHIPETTKIDAR
ncbi:hypothetical protein [Pseudanabaena sp. UWO310]|uniref:hypothetical protein n=1 Tax=Pseudanabaena sp. UWO310 TaxID=2480795 RepID=UPI00115AD667|nr:hypothetical protein [Pseudanabaena sp. UWO310]TYQ30747.1 hypothetical protein PseudUWO310_07400 [Pseudanabaena sp. UWO310]